MNKKEIPISTQCGYYEAQFNFLLRTINSIAKAETLEVAKSHAVTAQDILISALILLPETNPNGMELRG